MGKHETQTLQKVNIFDVDINIVSVVNWLNSFESVNTQWSCEDNGDRPYVVFTCFSLLSLTRIADTLARAKDSRIFNTEDEEDILIHKPVGELIVTCPTEHDPYIRFKLTFGSKDLLERFKTFLK
jgi:hypothetical protein